MRRVLVVAAVIALWPAAASAQALRAQCANASRDDVARFCGHVADAAAIMQPRIGIALSGGNPVPGTASTLGMRLGSMPRFSISARVTAAEVETPGAERMNDSSTVAFPVGSIAADVSVGLFSGISLLPTVGGFGSIDLLGSIGIIPLPHGEGFDDSAPLTWAAGARVGILRESFTAPGISVSAMYRRLGDLTFGDSTLTDRDAFFTMSDYSAYSVRGTVGKRVLGFGLTGGIGWDRYSSDVSGSLRDPVVLDPANMLRIQHLGMTEDRLSAFGNVSFTLLILNMSAELGWQQGGSSGANGSDLVEKAGLFGGLALRLAI